MRFRVLVIKIPMMNENFLIYLATCKSVYVTADKKCIVGFKCL